MAEQTIRCKFRVQKVAEVDNSWNKEKRYQEVTMGALYADGSTENQSFAEATTSGTFMFNVSNQAVIDAFKPGDEYYLDLTRVNSEKDTATRMPAEEKEEREARARAQGGEKGRKASEKEPEHDDLDDFQKKMCQVIACKELYCAKRADLYRNTQFGHEVLKRG